MNICTRGIKTLWDQYKWTLEKVENPYAEYGSWYRLYGGNQHSDIWTTHEMSLTTNSCNGETMFVLQKFRVLLGARGINMNGQWRNLKIDVVSMAAGAMV